MGKCTIYDPRKVFTLSAPHTLRNSYNNTLVSNSCNNIGETISHKYLCL